MIGFIQPLPVVGLASYGANEEILHGHRLVARNSLSGGDSGLARRWNVA